MDKETPPTVPNEGFTVVPKKPTQAEVRKKFGDALKPLRPGYRERPPFAPSGKPPAKD